VHEAVGVNELEVLQDLLEQARVRTPPPPPPPPSTYPKWASVTPLS
jgi:hypothetical protein